MGLGKFHRIYFRLMCTHRSCSGVLKTPAVCRVGNSSAPCVLQASPCLELSSRFLWGQRGGRGGSFARTDLTRGPGWILFSSETGWSPRAQDVPRTCDLSLKSGGLDLGPARFVSITPLPAPVQPARGPGHRLGGQGSSSSRARAVFFGGVWPVLCLRAYGTLNVTSSHVSVPLSDVPQPKLRVTPKLSPLLNVSESLVSLDGGKYTWE